MSMACSRLAPSPTGALHLGNARTFLFNWALARSRGWRLAMRLEDFDGPRIKPGADLAAFDLLTWLGLDWDGPPLIQSHDRDPYVLTMQQLASAGLVYPCTHTRREISAASAPHEGDHEVRFGPELRPANAAQPRHFDGSMQQPGVHWRLRVDPEDIEIDDRIRGRHRFDPAMTCGDFTVWTVRNEPAYQLAVVIDDLRQNVTEVVRGDDLLESAARQALLYRHLQAKPPNWWHLPLVRGSDGRRLAKRHGDTRIASYQACGVPANRIIGLLACWCGLVDRPQPMSAADVLDLFDASLLPQDDVIVSREDEAWLCG